MGDIIPIPPMPIPPIIPAPPRLLGDWEVAFSVAAAAAVVSSVWISSSTGISFFVGFDEFFFFGTMAVVDVVLFFLFVFEVDEAAAALIPPLATVEEAISGVGDVMVQ